MIRALHPAVDDLLVGQEGGRRAVLADALVTIPDLPYDVGGLFADGRDMVEVLLLEHVLGPLHMAMTT